MNEQTFNYTNSEKCSNSSDNGWKDIDWKKAEEHINRLQLRIVKAVENKKWNLVKRLQHLLINSFYAKALAVKKVTSNKGGKTSGVDKVLWSTDKRKYEAIDALNSNQYKPLPTRRIYIKKANGKLRPLSIPAMKDRAMQSLHLLSLCKVANYILQNRMFYLKLNYPND